MLNEKAINGMKQLGAHLCRMIKDVELKSMKVIFNPPATILYRNDKKYVAKCDKGDTFSEELGLAICLLKSYGLSYSDFEKVLKNSKKYIFLDKTQF